MISAAPRIALDSTADTSAIGVRAKVENEQQYSQYLEELKDIREDLGVALVEDLYPELALKK